MSLWRCIGRIGYWLIWPALCLYAPLTKRTRVLVRVGDEVLLVQGWLSDGKWSLPGGGLHRHEDPTRGALREVTEETGIPLLPEQCALLASEWYKNRGVRYFCYYFAAELPLPIVPKKQRGEISDIGWFSIDALQNLDCKPEVSRAIELWSAK